MLSSTLYDGQGFWVCHKRLSKGRFHWWPDKKESGLSVLQAHELQSLIWNANPWARGSVAMWKSIAA
jgi:transposase